MSQEPLIAILDRPLGEEDLLTLEIDQHSKAPTLKRLTHRHHRLARMIAEGIGHGDAAIACGYSNSRVSILMDDVAFMELVDFYAKQVDALALDLRARLVGIAETASDIIQDRLEEDPDSFEVEDLRKLVALGADRTGHGPTSTQNHNHVVGFAARLDRARERRQVSKIEEAEVIDVRPHSPGA